MDQNKDDLAVVPRTPPDRDEAELASFQSMLERREAAMAQPLVQDAEKPSSAKPVNGAGPRFRPDPPAPAAPAS